jgi:antirestriction protein ArdC
MSTLAHECVHATGAKQRCDRQLTGRFGDEAYAMEELIAELGAAFISGQWGQSYQLEQHASYLASWLKVFKSDPKALFAASTKATQAVAYIENSLRTHRCERSSLDQFIIDHNIAA